MESKIQYFLVFIEGKIQYFLVFIEGKIQLIGCSLICVSSIHGQIEDRCRGGCLSVFEGDGLVLFRSPHADYFDDANQSAFAEVQNKKW